MTDTDKEMMRADGLGKFVGEETRMPSEAIETKLSDERIKHETPK
jgi:hypothetical protein